MEKIVILNNNEYVEKLHLPSYKARIVNRSNEAIPSIKKSTSKNSKSEEKLKSEYINIADERKIKRDDEKDARFTFNMRKESKATEVSDASFKDKYEQIYDTYVNSISYVPGFKNRSSAVKAVLSFGQAQNSFSHPSKYLKMPQIGRNDEVKFSSRNIINNIIIDFILSS